MRVVQAAADIIREDIYKQPTETSEYLLAEIAFQDPLSVIPNSLSTLIDRIISKRKRGSRKFLDRKVASISHAIMSVARPRSFLSMFQVGLSVHMHHRLGSVNILHNLSFAASYKESKRYELPATMSSMPEIIDNSFHQWIFDNADVNTRTIDGYGTWHGMGGAMEVTHSIRVCSSCTYHPSDTGDALI